MNILDTLVGILQILVLALMGYALIKALIGGYTSEKKIHNLTRRVNRLQDRVDQLESVTNNFKHKERN